MSEEKSLSRSLGPSFMTAPVHLGQALDQTGQQFFYNASSALATGFQAGNATAAVTYTWPTAGPAGNNYVLGSSTVGALSWINAPGTYAPIGAAFVTIGNDATLTADRALTGTTNQIVVTDNGANSTVVLSTPQNINSSAAVTFGSLTLTAQPSFSAYLSATASNVTGDNTDYAIIPDAEFWDLAGNYSTSTGLFTAPRNGYYLFTVNIVLLQLTVTTHTTIFATLSTSNRNYQAVRSIVAGTSYTDTISFSAIADMETNDTAGMKIEVDGSSAVVDVQGTGAGGRTFFTGSLLN